MMCDMHKLRVLARNITYRVVVLELVGDCTCLREPLYSDLTVISIVGYPCGWRRCLHVPYKSSVNGEVLRKMSIVGPLVF